MVSIDIYEIEFIIVYEIGKIAGYHPVYGDLPGVNIGRKTNPNRREYFIHIIRVFRVH